MRWSKLKKIIEEQKGKNKSAAKLALTIIKSKKIDLIDTKKINKSVDEIIVDIVNMEKAIVATQDKLLKGRIKSKTKVITLRKKKYLIMV